METDSEETELCFQLWEESSETVSIGGTTLRRFIPISDIIELITEHNSPMNYELVDTVLTSLPSICTPSDFFSRLMTRFSCSKVHSMKKILREQIQLKVLTVLRYWAKSPSAHCDFSGLLIESILDFVANTLSEFATVKSAFEILLTIFTKLREDLHNFETSKRIYFERVKAVAFIETSESIIEGESDVYSPSSMGLITPIRIDSDTKAQEFDSDLRSSRSSRESLSSIYLGIESSKDILARQSSRESLSSICLGIESNKYCLGEPSNLSLDIMEETLDGETHTLDWTADEDDTYSNHTTKSIFKHSPHKDTAVNENLSPWSMGVNRKIQFSRGISEGSNIPYPDKKHELSNGFRSSSLGNLRTPPSEKLKNNNIISLSNNMRGDKPACTVRASVIKIIPHDELVNCLLISEYEFYIKSIRPREFIGMAWTKKALKTLHPDLGGAVNLCRLVHSTNQRIAWIAREVIDYARFHGSAAEAIEYWIRVARGSLKMNNFNTLFQVVAALGLPAVRHLKAGWSHVASSKKSLFKTYTKLCSADSNYGNYRRALAQSGMQPTIPCIQVTARDIAILEAAGPWRSGGKVDMAKAQSMYSAISAYLHHREDDSFKYHITIKNSDYCNNDRNELRECSVSGSIIYGDNTMKNGISTPTWTNASETIPSNVNSNSNNAKSSRASDSIMVKWGYSIGVTSVTSDATLTSRSSIISFTVAYKIIRDSFFNPTLDLEEERKSISNCNVASDQSITVSPDSSNMAVLDSITPNMSVTTGNHNKITTSSGGNSKFPPREAILSGSAMTTTAPTAQAIRKHSSVTGGSRRDDSKERRRSGPFGFGIADRLISMVTGRPRISSGVIMRVSGSDITLSLLHFHIHNVNVDLNSLWEDAKVAEEEDTKRIIGQLSRAGGLL